MTDIQLQNNESKCIQSQNQITGTSYVNICTGKTTFVPYGNGDWLGVILSVGIMIGVLIWIKKLIDY